MSALVLQFRPKVEPTILHIEAAICRGGACNLRAGEKVEKHPNKLPFTGTLLVLDAPSTKPPHGAEGHRIYVPSSVARKRLKTIIGMALNYASDLSGHAVTRKVGVITGAWIDGNLLKVKGHIWKKDFPNAEKDLHDGRMGMSMELADVYVRSRDDDVWRLEDFHFSGATALYKSAAAYYQTALAAKAALVRSEGGRMATKVKKVNAAGDGQGELLVKSISAAVQTAIQGAFAPVVTLLKKQDERFEQMNERLEEVSALHASAVTTEDEEEEESEDIAAEGEDEEEEEQEEPRTVRAAKKKKKGEEDGDGEDEGEGEDDDEDEEDDAEMEADGLEHLEDDEPEEEPGEINKDAKNEGDKTTRTGKVGKDKSMKELVKASRINASALVRELYAQVQTTKKKYKKLELRAARREEAMQNKLDALEAQVENYAERVDRKTIAPELATFLAKSSVDIRELQATGQKLTVSFVDEMFAASPTPLDPTTRMWFKNQLLAAGMMEQGEIVRR